MTTNPHTPGPWNIRESAWPQDAFLIEVPRRHIAMTRGALASDEANANLIAAAPDLLALAKSMMRAIETCEGQPIGAWREAIAMHIAKAEGQTLE